MGVCNCSMVCCALLYVHSSIAIILMGKRELIALLNLSYWCLVMVEQLFLAVPRGCLQFVIVVFLDHTHYFWLKYMWQHLHCFKQLFFGEKRLNILVNVLYFFYSFFLIHIFYLCVGVEEGRPGPLQILYR